MREDYQRSLWENLASGCLSHLSILAGGKRKAQVGGMEHAVEKEEISVAEHPSFVLFFSSLAKGSNVSGKQDILC